MFEGYSDFDEKKAIQEITNLEKKIEALEAQLVSTRSFAIKYAKDMAKKNFFGSGIILEIKSLGGKQLLGNPVMVANGLSKETWEHIIKDLENSLRYSLELVPEYLRCPEISEDKEEEK